MRLHPDLTLAEAQEIVAAHEPWDGYSTKYRQYEPDYLPRVCEALAGIAPGRSLEVGPGWGTMMVWMAARGWQVEVCDFVALGHWITPELLALAGATFHQRDIFMGPLAFAAYDLVLMTQVLPHLKFRPDDIVRFCAEMLKPEGVLVTSAINAENGNVYSTYGTDWRAVPQWGSAPAGLDMVTMMFTPETLRELLKECFAEVEITQPAGVATMLAVCKGGR